MKSLKQFLTEQVALRPDTTYVYDHHSKTVHDVDHNQDVDHDWPLEKTSPTAKIARATKYWFKENPRPLGNNQKAYDDHNNRFSFAHLDNLGTIHMWYLGNNAFTRSAVMVKALTDLEPGSAGNFRVRSVYDDSSITADKFIQAFHPNHNPPRAGT